MATNVYAWPPVAAVGSEWTIDAPVSVSRSLIANSGGRYVSAALRERRLVTLQVSALGRGRSGAGYSESLKRLLKGGEHLVRLHSKPINWHIDHRRERAMRQSELVSLSDGGAPVSITDGGTPATLYEGRRLWAVPAMNNGWHALRVSGLQPNKLAARPAEFLTIFADDADATGSTHQVVTEAHANQNGVAIVRIFEQAPFSGRVNLGTSDTGIFEVVDTLPRAVQPVTGDWTYGWTFSQVFEDEIGPIQEVNPWI